MIKIAEIAYFGGKPTIDKALSTRLFKHPNLKEKDFESVIEVLKDRDLSFPKEGGIIRRLEKAFSDYLDSTYVLACNNGTSAILSAYFALGDGLEPIHSFEGKEIICPSYTWWASIEQVLLLGGKPVFCDISLDTLTLDPQDLENKITKKTAVIMVPHLWGEVSDLKKISKLSKRYGIPIIEDASHCMGASYDGKKVGTLFNVGAFSLQAGKPLAAGEGGLFVTNNKKLYERAILLGHYERVEEMSKNFWKYSKTGLGYKFRISSLNAALALSQIEGYDGRIKKENELMDYFLAQLENLEAVRIPRQKYNGFKRGGFFSTRLILDLDFFSVNKKTLIAALSAEGIPVEEEYYPLLHLQERFKQKSHYWGKGALPTSEKVYPSLIAMPAFRRGSIKDVERFSEGFKKVCNCFKR